MFQTGGIKKTKQEKIKSVHSVIYNTAAAQMVAAVRETHGAVSLSTPTNSYIYIYKYADEVSTRASLRILFTI